MKEIQNLTVADLRKTLKARQESLKRADGEKPGNWTKHDNLVDLVLASTPKIDETRTQLEHVLKKRGVNASHLRQKVGRLSQIKRLLDAGLKIDVLNDDGEALKVAEASIEVAVKGADQSAPSHRRDHWPGPVF